MPSEHAPLHVTVLGGGLAAAELLLGLCALAEERVELELITPTTQLPIRAASPGTGFGEAAVETYDLADIAAEVGARLRLDRAEAVATRARRVRLASGTTASYDALVVAVGARAQVGITGARTFRDQRDARVLEHLLDDLAQGRVRHVAFGAPAGVSWTVPLYELALLTAARGSGADVTLITPEPRALDVFGDAVSTFVDDLLDTRGVRLLTGQVISEVRRDGLRLGNGSHRPADRVIAVPRLVGRRLTGIPCDRDGFIPADRDGRVIGVEHVSVAGDVRAFAVKQGGPATQQADVIAARLAARAGADVPAEPVRHVLRTRLLGADRPVYLRAELDADGRPVNRTSEVVLDEPPWWPGAKVTGRRITPWMAAHTAA